MKKQEAVRIQELIEAAIQFARRGIPVFPLHYATESGACSCKNPDCERVAKHPLTRNGFKDATTDVATICQYWQSHPLANIGIPTGSASGFFVVDVDPRHGGHDSLARYESDHGPLSATVRVNTGGGGQHIFFKHPGTVIRNKTGILPGIDIRGDGGYIVAPPSNHASGGSYKWQAGAALDDLPLADIPDALANLLTDNTDKNRRHPQGDENEADGSCRSEDEEIPEGTRNDTLFRLACKLQRIGLTFEACRAALHEENLIKCNPALDETEVDRIVESAFRYSDDPNHIEWSRPVPLPPLEPDVPMFPQNIIPEPFRDWIQDTAERLQLPFEMIAAPAMVSFGSLVGCRCAIYPKREDTDWIEFPNLWGAVVAPPGWMKSPALKEVLKPIETLDAKATEHFEQEQRQWKNIKQTLDLKVTATQKALTKAIEDGNARLIEREQRNLAQLQAEIGDGTPKHRRYLANDATVEKLGEILSENPNGILVFRDELYGLLKGMEKQGRETERTFYLESWSGNRPYKVDRIQRGTVTIPSVCLSVLGGIQPDPLSDYFSNVVKGESGGDGFLSRFGLLVCPSSRVSQNWKIVDRKPDNTARERAFAIFERVAQVDFRGLFCRTSPNGKPVVHFNQEAQEFFYGWWHRLETRLLSGELGSSAFASHLTKYRKLMPALALLFHIIEVLDGLRCSQAVAQPLDVSLSAAQMAASWCEILETHARKIYAGAVNPSLQAAHALSRKLIDGQITDGMSVRDIYRKKWSFLSSSEVVTEGLSILEKHGWLKVLIRQASANGGASSEYVRVNPKARTSGGNKEV